MKTKKIKTLLLSTLALSALSIAVYGKLSDEADKKEEELLYITD